MKWKVALNYTFSVNIKPLKLQIFSTFSSNKITTTALAIPLAHSEFRTDFNLK